MTEIRRDKLYKGISEIAARIGENEDRTWRLLKRHVLPAYRHSKRGGWRMIEGDYVDYLSRMRDSAA